MKNCKRVLAVIIAIIMCLQTLPMNVLASSVTDLFERKAPAQSSTQPLTNTAKGQIPFEITDTSQTYEITRVGMKGQLRWGEDLLTNDYIEKVYLYDFTEETASMESNARICLEVISGDGDESMFVFTLKYQPKRKSLSI